MKNTGIIYSSTERTPVVLPEMAELLPPLSEEQLGALETDLLKNGCYTSIIVNEDLVVIDGHNRKSLCDKHGLPYQMLVFAFDDLLEAKQWALDTQKGRRNLDKWELGKIALKLKPEIEARAKANQGTRTDLSATLPESSVPVDTRKELADSVGLGERTMGKVMQIDELKVPVGDVCEGYFNDAEEGVVGYDERLDIRPKYQREFVYKDAQRDEVIRTVMKGLPLNVMYWVKTGTDTYEVLDGQQRTLSIMQYLSHKFSTGLTQHLFNRIAANCNHLFGNQRLIGPKSRNNDLCFGFKRDNRGVF